MFLVVSTPPPPRAGLPCAPPPRGLDDRCAPNASMIAVWTSPPAATGARSTQNGRPPAARQRSTATAPADYSALAVRLGLD
jgi:hypothetical protein